MAVKKKNIKELTQALKDKLETEVMTLPEAHRRVVEIPPTLDRYKLKNGFGAFLIVPIGGQFSKPKTEHAVIQDHDIEIAVVVVANYITDHPTPTDYVQFAIDALSGLEIENNRPERKVYPIMWEAVDDKQIDFEWWYKILFSVPADNYEKEFENQM